MFLICAEGSRPTTGLSKCGHHIQILTDKDGHKRRSFALIIGLDIKLQRQGSEETIHNRTVRNVLVI